MEIKVTLWNIEQQSLKINSTRELVMREIPPDLFKVCIRMNNNRYDRLSDRVKKNNIKKLSSLVNEKLNRNALCNTQKHVLNFTHVSLPNK